MAPFLSGSELPQRQLKSMPEHPTQSGPCTALCAQHSTYLPLRLDCPPQHLSNFDGQTGQHLLWGVTHRSSNSHRRGLLLSGRLLRWGQRQWGRPWRRCHPGCKRVMQSRLWHRARLCLRLENRAQRTIWLWCRLPLQGVSSKRCLEQNVNAVLRQGLDSIVLQGLSSAAANSNKLRTVHQRATKQEGAGTVRM